MSTPAVIPPYIALHLVDSNQMISVDRIQDPVRMQRINTKGIHFSGYQLPGVAIDGNPMQLTNVVPKEVAERYFRGQPMYWDIIQVDASGMPVDRKLCIEFLAWLDKRYPGHSFAALYADYLAATDPAPKQLPEEDPPVAEKPKLPKGPRRERQHVGDSL